MNKLMNKGVLLIALAVTIIPTQLSAYNQTLGSYYPTPADPSSITTQNLNEIENEIAEWISRKEFLIKDVTSNLEYSRSFYYKQFIDLLINHRNITKDKLNYRIQTLTWYLEELDFSISESHEIKNTLLTKIEEIKSLNVVAYIPHAPIYIDQINNFIKELDAFDTEVKMTKNQFQFFINYIKSYLP